MYLFGASSRRDDNAIGVTAVARVWAGLGITADATSISFSFPIASRPFLRLPYKFVLSVLTVHLRRQDAAFNGMPSWQHHGIEKIIRSYKVRKHARFASRWHVSARRSVSGRVLHDHGERLAEATHIAVDSDTILA